MPSMIHIERIPDGHGTSAIREPYVGCTLPLADPHLVSEAEVRYAELKAVLPPVYWVRFPAVLDALEQIGRVDWAHHLRTVTAPEFIRFPKDCARLIEV